MEVDPLGDVLPEQVAARSLSTRGEVLVLAVSRKELHQARPDRASSLQGLVRSFASLTPLHLQVPDQGPACPGPFAVTVVTLAHGVFEASGWAAWRRPSGLERSGEGMSGALTKGRPQGATEQSRQALWGRCRAP
ncbi:hypothetical protein PBI_PAEDORE_2 [Streptomyces phage Paedore]|uniref:Uncharacterized protein n=1 Tax=Streptomyces phage Paedore TaxID=2108134 RepID=A0A2P1JTL3_9CAUD|nr:hypothetical protein KGG91_gp02 [Streptomyces phage Paedore]AVO22485.1 hypothetical protein PBI_PAEDORE_2 [Streptomyces phage Paedore]